MIWFNPPFNKSVQTNIGKSFLLLVQKHFRPNHKFHNIFNKNKLNSKYGNNKVIRTDPKKYTRHMPEKEQRTYSTITQIKAYNNVSKDCNLCLTERFYIVKAYNSNILKKRDKLISKCRHEIKFYIIMNYKLRRSKPETPNQELRRLN